MPPRLGAILSLLVLVCAPAPAARAGCSAHYLTSRAPAGMESLALDPLILGGSVLPPHGEVPPSRPTPCSGALCSGSPAVPPSTVPPVMPGGDGDRAISDRPPVLADPGSIAGPAEDTRLLPIDHPSAIFHPPRRPGPRPTA